MTIELIISLTLTIVIFFLSRKNTKLIFSFFLRYFGKKTAHFLLTLIFLPGTLIHEISHFLMATILFQKVKEISILPQIKKDGVKLGYVLYYKTDFLRGTLVGVAPIFGAMFTFYFFSLFKLFPQENLLINIFFIFLIFSISSNMFSSKQDLVDLIYFLPTLAIIYGILYILGINIFITLSEKTTNVILTFLKQVNSYLFLTLLIHLAIYFIKFTVRLFSRG